MLARLASLVQDPPPSLVVEISESAVAVARLGPKSRHPETIAVAPLPAGVVQASPVRENVHDPAELDRAVREALEQNPAPRKRREAALLLPDNCARFTVLEFENLPGNAAERLSLLRWRLKKAVPFDADTASIAYQVQRAPAGSKTISVLAVVSPAEVIAQYESALRRMGLIPGFVSTSVSAALNLVTEQGVTMVAKLSGRFLTLVVIDQGQVRLVRSLETGAQDLDEPSLREMATDLYPTFVYVADNFGAPVSKLLLADFGPVLPLATEVFRRELGSEPQVLRGPAGNFEQQILGIWGFLGVN